MFGFSTFSEYAFGEQVLLAMSPPVVIEPPVIVAPVSAGTVQYIKLPTSQLKLIRITVT